MVSSNITPKKPGKPGLNETRNFPGVNRNDGVDKPRVRINEVMSSRPPPDTKKK
jgi:hypothetical protein